MSINIICAIEIFSASAFSCSCTRQSHTPAAAPICWTSWFAATGNHLGTAFGYRLGARVFSLGTSFPSSEVVHHMVSGSGRVGFLFWPCFHNIAWKCTLATCHHAASLVGGSASGDLHQPDNVARASSQPSALPALYTGNEFFYGLHSRVIQVSIFKTFQ